MLKLSVLLPALYQVKTFVSLLIVNMIQGIMIM